MVRIAAVALGLFVILSMSVTQAGDGPKTSPARNNAPDEAELRRQVAKFRDYAAMLENEIKRRDEEHIGELADRDAQLARKNQHFAELEKRLSERTLKLSAGQILIRTRGETANVTIVDPSLRTFAGRDFIGGRAINKDVGGPDYKGNVVWVAVNDVCQIIEMANKK